MWLFRICVSLASLLAGAHSRGINGLDGVQAGLPGALVWANSSLVSRLSWALVPAAHTAPWQTTSLCESRHL